MEAQTDIQTYLEQGKQALAQGLAREAAIAYAHGAQLEANNPEVHLGLAEANLALGNYGVVHMACRRVHELQPTGGLESQIAQALIDLLDRRYERALQNIDAVISEEPGIAYAHALRGYLLRATGQDYDANLASARGARLSYGGRFNNCFPALEASATSSSSATPSASPAQGNGNGNQGVERESVPSWSPPSRMQRQVVRTRFALSQYPSLFTYILIALNVVMYLFSMLNGNLYNLLTQSNEEVMQGAYWQLFTAMFMHANIMHLGLNMLSLFFVGRFVEILFGKWRYLVIYFVSGFCGNLLSFLIFQAHLFPPDPNSPFYEVGVLGASGAIFGVFGALGIFYLMNRRAVGPGMISNWLLWLVLNLAFSFSGGISLWAHVGGLVSGMIITALLIPRQRRRRYF